MCVCHLRWLACTPIDCELLIHIVLIDRYYMRRAIALLLSGLWAVSASHADTASGAFNVLVNLQSHPTGICISTTLSQQTNALVRVTCQGEQFVSIEPRKGRPFLGTHGGAHRIALTSIKTAPSGWLHPGELDPWIGRGTITSLRVLNLTERDERLELLVSF